MFWFIFSSNTNATKSYYPGMTDNTLSLLLNYGPICFIPLLPFAT